MTTWPSGLKLKTMEVIAPKHWKSLPLNQRSVNSGNIQKAAHLFKTCHCKMFCCHSMCRMSDPGQVIKLHLLKVIVRLYFLNRIISLLQLLVNWLTSFQSPFKAVSGLSRTKQNCFKNYCFIFCYWKIPLQCHWACCQVCHHCQHGNQTHSRANQTDT